MHKQFVTDDSTLWSGTAEDSEKALEEYQSEIDEIVATLPLRTDSNRTETINYLKGLGVPNQFNRRHPIKP